MPTEVIVSDVVMVVIAPIGGDTYTLSNIFMEACCETGTQTHIILVNNAF
jgi:hypothetical protein